MHIDTHAFWGKNKILGFNYTVGMYKQIAKEHMDIKFIITSISPESNHEIADVVNQNPDLFLKGQLFIVPKENQRVTHTPVEELEELCKDKAVGGLKIIPYATNTAINNPSYDAYFELATQFDIPVLIHCSKSGTKFTSYQKIDSLSTKHPNTKIILAHLGGLNKTYIEGSIDLAIKHKNIYLNTTGTSGEERRIIVKNDCPEITEMHSDLKIRRYWGRQVRKIMQGKAKNKLLIGSDFPFLSFQEYPLELLTNSEQKIVLATTKEIYKINS